MTQNFLQANGINVMDWPAMSADMSPIEHVWDELGRRVPNRVQPPAISPAVSNAYPGMEQYFTFEDSESCSENASSLSSVHTGER